MVQKRLDSIVADKLKISRSLALKLVETGKVSIAKKILDKPGKKYLEDTELVINFDQTKTHKNIDIDVIYEDEHCVVVDKPTGVLSHSKGEYNPEATVATWFFKKSKGFDENDDRAGIVHRLDRGTSGVMLLAKTPESLNFFQKQFSKRNVKKTYIAVIEKELDQEEALINIPIMRNEKDPKRFKVSNLGKPSQTKYQIIRKFTINGKKFSLVELQPKTGRTHQLRVHLKHLKRPIVGDAFYGGLPAKRLYLHAQKLEITLPNSERKIFESVLPKSFMSPKIK